MKQAKPSPAVRALAILAGFAMSLLALTVELSGGRQRGDFYRPALLITGIVLMLAGLFPSRLAPLWRGQK